MGPRFGASNQSNELAYAKHAKELLTQLLGLEVNTTIMPLYSDSSMVFFQNDPGLLEGKLHIYTFPPGHTITEQGSEVSLIFTVSFCLTDPVIFLL